ncbi:MAG: ATP-binding cassette domain-containing protein [Lachnospiraceae bacterium]|nr:ATP-binding cassette domain-containing protein [Lachnospiraceae bacterium]
MSWFDDQITERRRNDEQELEDAFIRTAGIVLGKKQKYQYSDKRISAQSVIDDLLKYYRLKTVRIPDNLEQFEEQMDYSMRYYGIMRREIILEEKWYKRAVGPILTYRKEDKRPVAMIPAKSGGYRFSRDGDGKKVKVSSRNARSFEEKAICFYQPLPMTKIGIVDLLRYMKGYLNLWDFLYFIWLAFLLAVVGINYPRLTKFLTGSVLDGGQYNALIGTAVFMIAIFVTSWLLESVKDLIAERMKRRMLVGVQSAMMMRMMSLPTGFFKKYSIGEIKSRQNSVSDLCELLLDIVLGAGISALFSLIYLTQIINISEYLASVTLQVLFLNVIVILAISFIQTRVSRRELQRKAEEFGVSFSIISGIKKIKMTGAEKRVFAKWLNLYSKWADVKFNPPRLVKAGPVITMAIGLGVNIVLYLISFVGGVNQSSYYSFTVAYAALFAAFSMLSESAVSIGQLRPAFEMAQPFFQTVPEMRTDREVITRLSGRIEMENVYFRYREDSPYILNNLSLKIEPGEYVAIVGETGCGKSTLIRLLLGFETTDRGSIYYDGRELKNIDPSSLRRRIGTVLQQGDLFQGDIYSNIVITAPELTQEDAWRAAEIAGIAEDIRNMPMEMHTLITEGGGGISGGQKQRIMIARAIAPKPRILFLDEATSALDNVTQKQVSDALDEMGCTRIVIAHRLSTIRNCDRILVLKDGQIAEDGTYEELIEKNGLFAELVDRQRIDS